MDRLDLETAFSEVSRILRDPRRCAPRMPPVRRDAPAGDAGAVARWRREIDRAIGLVHLRAAAIRRALRTKISHRRARYHLRQAIRAGYFVRAGARRLVLAVTKRATLRSEKDLLRH